MDAKEGKQDYVQFMHWFERHYPALHAAHGHLITVPVDGEGVTVEKDGMPMTVYHEMVSITKRYYQLESRG